MKNKDELVKLEDEDILKSFYACSKAIYMRSIMDGCECKKTRYGIPIILGKNIAGKPVLLDLEKAPQLLIAGSDNVGQKECINTLIMSLISRFSPKELRLILVDSKGAEFEAYSTLPHLITPVINDSLDAPIALQWVFLELERRYRILTKAKVKNLAEFNSRVVARETLCDHDGLPIPNTMPRLVVIVDELADLMMTDVKKDVENSIVKIAQKGRAAGIHIVIATKKPSRKTVTSLIQSNFPTKIAFKVESCSDSKLILDKNGAETLLGKGDMLLDTFGQANFEHIQVAIVEDDDIKRAVKYISEQAKQDFNASVIAKTSAD